MESSPTVDERTALRNGIGTFLLKTGALLVLLMLALGTETAQAQDHFLELSGYIGGEGNETANAAAIHTTGNWKYMYVVGRTSSKKSWMPAGPRRGGIAPGCSPQRLGDSLTVQCGGFGVPRNGYIARYTIAGKPSGFAFFGSAGGAAEVTDIAVNDQGHIFIAGWTAAELTYGRNLYNGGERDAFVARIDTTKFDPDDTGPALEETNSPVRWAKHLGGDGRDRALAVTTNDLGNPVVVGATSSDNFPTAGTETRKEADDDSVRFETEVEEDQKEVKKQGKLDKVQKSGILQQPRSNSYRGGTSDAFVTEISKDGLTIESSYFLGGDAEDVAHDVAVTGDTAYVAGHTKSAEVRSPWGTISGGSGGGDSDAFLYESTVLTVHPDTGQIISDRGGDQVATSVTVINEFDDTKSAVVGGYTENTYTNSTDGFVALFKDVAGNTRGPSTFNRIGYDADDRINDIAASNKHYAASNSIYLVGTTGSDELYAQGSLPDTVSKYRGGKDAFMMKMSHEAKDIDYLALAGGSGDDRGLGLALNNNEIFNMFGSTNSSDFVYKRAPARNLEGGSDGFVTRLSPEDMKPTNLALSLDLPSEFRMEQAPLPFTFEIDNTSETDAKDVTLSGSIEGGRIVSTPDECTTSGSRNVTCSYNEVLPYDLKEPIIEVEPFNAPGVVKGSFELTSSSREYKMDDNEVSDSTEVLSRINLKVDFIEVTQGIQDRRHSIPLVKDKTAYARVYVTATRRTVDSGVLQVDTGPFSAEMSAWDRNGKIIGSPIRPVAKAPASIRPIEGSVRGISVSANLGDTLNGHQVIGEVGAGNDAYRYTGSRPSSISLDNSSGAEIEHFDENRIVITGEGKTGDTEYTIVVDSVLSQPNRQLIGHRVSKDSDDELNTERTKVTGTLDNDPDGITYKGELKRMKLGNPAAANVLVEQGGVIVIKSKGGTEYTIDDTTKIDANRFDRNARQAFDFRLPTEWTDGEQLKLEATVNPNNSIDEFRGGAGNTEETEVYELWELSPICIRTQPVRTNSSTPDADLRDNEKGPHMINLANTLMPSPQIRIYPNHNTVTPGWAEPGNTFELKQAEKSKNENDDGSKIIWLLGWRNALSSPPAWCDQRGARTHWAGLVNPDDANYGGRGKIGGKLFWIDLTIAKTDWEQINSPYAGTSLAHELGHNYSFNHVNCPPSGDDSPDGPYENYPFDNCLVGPDKEDAFFGYDTREPGDYNTPGFAGQRGIHPNLPASTPRLDMKKANISDIMSYADYSWSSSYYWMKLFLKFNRGLVEPSGSKINPAFGKQNDLEAMNLEMQDDSTVQKSFSKSVSFSNSSGSSGGPMAPDGIPDARALDFSNNDVKPEPLMKHEDAQNNRSMVQDELIVVKGLLHLDNPAAKRIEAVQLERSLLAPGEAEELLKTSKQNPDYPVRVILKNEAGDIIGSKNVQISRMADTGTPKEHMFTTAIPWDSAVDKVEIAMWNETMGSTSIADKAPTIDITSIEKEESMEEKIVSARWNVSGVPDTDRVHYMVHYSPDNGKSWQPVSMNYELNTIELDLAELAGSTENARLRVIAIWQGRSSSDVSDPFSVAGHNPETEIHSPKDGDTYKAGGQAYLKGSAYDLDDGYLAGDELQWTVSATDGDQQVTGSGEAFTIFDLSPGTYQVTLTATDSDGMSSTARSRFTVQPAGYAIPDSASLMMHKMPERDRKDEPEKDQEREDTDDTKEEKQEEPFEKPSDDGSTLTLVPKGGFSMPGVSSLGDIGSQVGSTIEGQNSVFTWGGSLTFGERSSFANFRLSGVRRSGTIATVLQNDQITTTEVSQNFTAFTADLVLRPIPRILVQPYAVGGFGFRKITFGSDNIAFDSNWKTTLPLGVGVDLQLGGDGLILGVEAVDYMSGFSGEGEPRHDAFLFGSIGIPL